MLSFAWLLPNHYQPWTAFHSDSWAAFVCGAGAIAIVFRHRTPVAWHGLPLLVAFLVPVPFLQFAGGLLPFAGQAWTSTAYLAGLMVALLMGAYWEKASAGQVADGLFLAIGLASILSVGLQLYQWLGLDGLEFSHMGFVGGRPYANLGQPNQLGTLLLWGVLAAGWGFLAGKIGPRVAILLACFLLFGIALTQSRTAWIGVALLVCAAFAARRFWPSKRLPWIVAALGLYFALCVAAVPVFQEYFELTTDHTMRMQGELRPLAWRLFSDAALQHPWLGYGWTAVSKAQLETALNHPGIGANFSHSHNLFLDLVLWCGFPLGLFVAGALLYWIFGAIRRVREPREVILLTFVLVVGNHAMLELPLHYAYFLIPTGLVIGMLNVRQQRKAVVHTPRWTLGVLWLAGMLVLAGIVRDYLVVEPNYYALRFERARVGKIPPAAPPDVVMLTQLREELRLARYAPKAGMSEAELNWIRQAAYINPGPSELYRLAGALALNGYAGEAQDALRKLCKLVPADRCDMARRVWAQDAAKQPKIAEVAWPN